MLLSELRDAADSIPMAGSWRQQKCLLALACECEDRQHNECLLAGVVVESPSLTMAGTQ